MTQIEYKRNSYLFFFKSTFHLMNFTVNLHFVLKEKEIRRKDKEQKTRKKRKDKFNKINSELDLYRLNNIVSVQNSLKKNWK